MASKVGAVDEGIEDGVDGILIGDGDLEGLQSALVRLIEDEARRERLVTNAIAKYRNKFGLERMRCEYGKLYAYCFGEGAPQCKRN